MIGEFTSLFLTWNQRINLSAARSRIELGHHIHDSLHVVSLLRDAGTDHALRVIDVGSGGGLPVVIAAICLPDARFTALEPVHKKHAFLRTVSRELGLPNLTPLAERFEQHTTHDYDVAMSRATFDLPLWLSIGASLVHASGTVIGFEAEPREDLPPSIERIPYVIDDRSRALIVSRRAAILLP